jgi:hypothetical protein
MFKNDQSTKPVLYYTSQNCYGVQKPFKTGRNRKAL